MWSEGSVGMILFVFGAHSVFCSALPTIFFFLSLSHRSFSRYTFFLTSGILRVNTEYFLRLLLRKQSFKIKTALYPLNSEVTNISITFANKEFGTKKVFCFSRSDTSPLSLPSTKPRQDVFRLSAPFVGASDWQASIVRLMLPISLSLSQ